MERLMILNILPAEGSFLTLRILNELRMSLSFKEDEIKNFNIVQKETGITWDTKQKDSVVEIEIGDKAESIIKEALEKVDKEKKAIPNLLSSYEKFVECKW